MRVVRYVDESRRLARALHRGSRQALRKAGDQVRERARDSLQVARRKTRGEMTRRERRIHAIRVSDARRRGRRMPDRPRRRSRPGQPPLVSSLTSNLRTGITSAFDIGSQSVVIGPIGVGVGQVPRVLEYGGTSDGVHIQARPFMRPALQAVVQSGAFGRLLEDMA